MFPYKIELLYKSSGTHMSLDRNSKPQKEKKINKWGIGILRT